MANKILTNYEEVLQKTDSQKILLAILLIGLGVYSPVFLGSQFLTYDDNWYIYENKNVIDLSWSSIVNIFTTLQGGQYSPLGEVYHAILYSIFGKNATAFKICALLVHLVNVTLLFKVFNGLFEDKVLVSFVALVFAIHPMQVETIGWISVIFRNAVFFMFLGYWFYIRYLENNCKKSNLIPVIVCFVLALFTKEQAVLFPVGLFLISLIKLETINVKRFWVEMVFWAILTMIFGLVTVEITKTGGPSIVNRSVSLYDKVGLLSKTILSYFYNFLFPFKLSFSYPYPLGGNSPSVFNMFFSLGVLLLGGYLSLKNKLFRFGFLWSFGFLSLGLAFAFFHLRDSFMADRYAYVAIIGFAFLLYLILKHIKKLLGNNKSLFFILVLGFLITFSIQSFNRVPVFKNSKSVWTQAVEANPNNQYAYNSLGFYYRTQKKLDTALVLYKRAIKIKPEYLAHSNIGKIYFSRKQYDSALYHVSQAIFLNPSYQRAYENRAAIYYKLKQKDSLLADLNKILFLDPDNIKYLKERAKISFEKKKYKETILDMEKILKYDKANDYAYYLIGHSNMAIKNYVDANTYLDEAIRLKKNKPNYYYIRSLCRVNVKNYKGALEDAMKAKKMGMKISHEYLMALRQQLKKSNE